MAPILKVQNLQLTRGKTAILRGIDWHVKPGENWVILGPNGCGKTSLLRSITGYMSASKGDIELMGRSYGTCDWRELRLHIGIVSNSLQSSIPLEEPALDTVMSGRYAQLDLWMRCTETDRRKARHWLRFLGCGNVAERPWLFLSQGEKQRVLLARALMSRPRLLILDEPCAGLDPFAREHFLSFIEQLAHKPKAPALVLVTHHVEEISPSFTHALLLKQGAVLDSGPLRKTLTSRALGILFDTQIHLSRKNQRYQLRVCS